MAHRFPLSTMPGDMVTLRSAMDRLFNDSFVPGYQQEQQLAPVNVSADDETFVVTAAVPGLDADDIDITIEKNVVRISGAFQSRESSDDSTTWYVQEIRSGSFERTLTLPANLDAGRAEATVHHGMLELRIPKAENEKPRRIQVQSRQSAPIEATAKESDANAEQDQGSEADAEAKKVPVN